MRHIPELDGLRAVAVTAVILYHASATSPVSGGFVGVDLFFVLSAFLISGVLENQSVGTFYLRRFLRLTPALYLLLLTSLAISPSRAMLRDVVVAGLYLSDYGFAFWSVPANFGHTWSLAVEEHFYLIWPFILPHLRKARQPGYWLAATYVVLTLWRLPFAGDLHSYYFRFDTHATGLIAGAWLYFVRPKISGPACGGSGAVVRSDPLRWQDGRGVPLPDTRRNRFRHHHRLGVSEPVSVAEFAAVGSDRRTLLCHVFVALPDSLLDPRSCGLLADSRNQLLRGARLGNDLLAHR